MLVRNPFADIKISYPTIEKLIESEDFKQLNKDFSALYDALEETAKKGGLKASKQAKIAMKGLEKVMDLLEELLKLKYRLVAGAQSEKAGEKKKK